MKFKIGIKQILSWVGSLLIVGVLVAANVVCSLYSAIITGVLCGVKSDFSKATEALAQSDALVQQIAEDSITLLKNKDNALPLSANERYINVFGYGATENGFLLRGLGSGSSTIGEKKAYSLVEYNNGNREQGALIKEGFEINDEIFNIFKNFSTGVRPKVVGAGNVYNLNEPDVSLFTPDMIARAKERSEVALFVISRCAGENAGEIPDAYLNITTKEQAILDLITANFNKVIVILNTSNTMHANFLDNDKVSAALSVGLMGQSGALAIPRILKGEKTVDGETVKVNPSGKLADVMTYTNEYDPTYVNRAPGGNGIQYSEGIYYGYKWYETADKENFFSAKNTSYDKVVQYPFGYGLSYTDFKWELGDIVMNTGKTDSDGKPTTVPFPAGSKLTLNHNGIDSEEITINVRVRNVGSMPGKDTVGLYCTPPYSGKVEKADVNLIDFAKTITLEANEEKYQNLELKFSAYDLASYDVNANDGKGAYVLESGDYVLSFRTDSHKLKADMPTVTFKVENDIELTKDNITGNEIKNRFTGENAYANCPVDGSSVNATQKYMTRSNFLDTFPATKATQSAPSSAVKNFVYTNKNLTENKDYNSKPVDSGLRLTKVKDTGDNPTASDLTGSGRTIEYNMELLEKLWDFDAPEWETLLDQLSRTEIRTLIQTGGFRRREAVSVGKALVWDYDGPAGFNYNTQGGNKATTEADKESWTAFCSECLIGQSWNKDLMFSLGRSMAAEGAATNLSGWYAPGVNLHRSAYTARNYEYYSEDGVLSGKLAANVIYGAKTNGMICYLKHFVCSEEGPNPSNVNTWLSEQNLRENYCRPFEIAVKEGKSNAIMTAFNNVGANWCGANGALVTEVLRGEWGFKGVVITDWCGGGSTGSYGACDQGVRAGNDLWLTFNTLNGSTYSDSNAADITSARYAAKNILYAEVDAKATQDSVKDVNFNDISVDMGIGFVEQPFRWWIILLVLLNVIGVAGIGALVWFYTVSPIIKSKNGGSAEGGDGEALQSFPDDKPEE